MTSRNRNTAHPRADRQDQSLKSSSPVIRDADNELDPDRRDRVMGDQERESEDGTILTIEERKRLLRAEWTSDILPEVKDDKGYWHYCWLTTSNTSDPVYKRLQLGYELVKYEEMQKLGVQNQITSGEFEGCVSINEMILARIPEELFQELMLINHHERPMEEEELLKANLVQDDEDSDGKSLGRVLGTGAQNLGRRVRRPVF